MRPIGLIGQILHSQEIIRRQWERIGYHRKSRQLCQYWNGQSAVNYSVIAEECSTHCCSGRQRIAIIRGRRMALCNLFRNGGRMCCIVGDASSKISNSNSRKQSNGTHECGSSVECMGKEPRTWSIAHDA